jgi:hypothetical protein
MPIAPRPRLRLGGPRREPPPPTSTDVRETFPWCLERGVDTRPEYLWGVLLAVRVARALALPSIAAIEFGVGSGDGLAALERAAAAATVLSGVDVAVYGFDSTAARPATADHRNAPWRADSRSVEPDEEALRARLTRAQLVLGSVAETVPRFVHSTHPPIGFLAFEFADYSATGSALGLLDAPAQRLLPRVSCCFQAVFGYGASDFTGERAAMADFNATREQRKIGKIHGLRYDLPASQDPLPWHEQMYLAHIFDHPDYNTPEYEPGG